MCASCPGTKAIERVFTLNNYYWSSETTQLSVKTLAAVLTVKFNMGEASCSDVSVPLDENSELTRKINIPT